MRLRVIACGWRHARCSCARGLLIKSEALWLLGPTMQAPEGGKALTAEAVGGLDCCAAVAVWGRIGHAAHVDACWVLLLHSVIRHALHGCNPSVIGLRQAAGLGGRPRGGGGEGGKQPYHLPMGSCALQQCLVAAMIGSVLMAPPRRLFALYHPTCPTRPTSRRFSLAGTPLTACTTVGHMSDRRGGEPNAGLTCPTRRGGNSPAHIAITCHGQLYTQRANMEPGTTGSMISRQEQRAYFLRFCQGHESF